MTWMTPSAPNCRGDFLTVCFAEGPPQVERCFQVVYTSMAMDGFGAFSGEITPQIYSDLVDRNNELLMRTCDREPLSGNFFSSIAADFALRRGPDSERSGLKKLQKV